MELKYKKSEVEEQGEKLEELWKPTGLLDEVKNRYERSVMAVLLENQRTANEILFEGDKADPRLMRLSIPFVRRVFSDFLPHQMVSVQPLLGPTGLVILLDGYGIPRNYEVSSKLMRLVPPVPDVEEPHDLDKEAEIATRLTIEYSQEITRHIIDDLRKSASIQLNHTYRSASDLVEFIKVANGKIVREVGRPATWMVVSPSIAFEIIEAEKDFHFFDISNNIRKEIDIHKFGLWNKRWTVYVDPLAPTTSVVMGHKGDSYLQSGYVFSPYIFYSQGIKEDNETHIVARVGKRLIYPGFYASINIGNYSIIEIRKEKRDEEFLESTDQGRRKIQEVPGTEEEGESALSEELCSGDSSYSEERDCESSSVGEGDEGFREEEQKSDGVGDATSA